MPPKDPDMVADIEEIVYKELNGLCGSCIHFEDCVYRKNSKKAVIQCEVFESLGKATEKNSVIGTSLGGLCLNCTKSRICRLPKEASGVWHCEEYE
jgi:hypothetical protein